MSAPAVELSVFLEHLERLCEKYTAVAVCKACNVSPAAVSQTRTATRPPSDALIERILAIYPLPQPKPAVAAVRGSTKPVAYHDEVTWLNTAQAQVIELVREAGDSKDEIDEVDRMLVSPSYQTMRQSLEFEFCGGCPEIFGVLLPPPETGPCEALRRDLGAIRNLNDESEKRQALVDRAASSEIYRRHSQFREANRRKIERLEKGDEDSAIVERGAWRTTVVSVCSLLQPLPDKRMRALDVLRTLQGNVFAESLAAGLEGVRSISFPCYEFQDDPAGFVRTILGEDPWQDPEGTDDDQVALLEAVRDNKRVVAPSARGVGKTKGVSYLSWWRFCSWDDGRVCISNFTGNQLRTQDWAEILRCLNRSGICLDCRRAGVTQRPCPHSQCIDAVPCETPTKGIWSADKERYIVGITGKEATALGGYHGIHILVICDEFSGLSYELFNAWKGNISGPEARFFGPGNCLDTAGCPMWDAVNDEKIRELYKWKVVNLSGEVAARTGLPYLPDAADLKADELSDERGRDNPLYMINNRGIYPKHSELCIYQPQHILRSQSVDELEAAEARGRLVIAIDPAGESGQGDELCVGAVRGFKLLEKRPGRGWTNDEYLDAVVELIERHRDQRNEPVIVAIDADGEGHKIANRFDDYLASKRLAEHEKVRFEVVRVFFGQKAPAKFEFDLVGDEAHFHLARWLARGGVTGPDDKLRQEMNVSKWFYVRRTIDGVVYDSIRSATRKDGPEGYRKLLHRSPDRLDMLRVFAYAAYMHNAFPVPEDKSENERQDEESQTSHVDATGSFREYMRNIRKGRHNH